MEIAAGCNCKSNFPTNISLMLACSILVAAIESPQEITLVEIYEQYGWSSDELINRSKLREILDEYCLTLTPDVGTGHSTEKRVLARRIRKSHTAYQSLISGGETATCEFKSSLGFDRKKYQYSNELQKTECWSEDVVFSTMKTIAGFSNTDGGTLFIGVDDAGNVLGLEDDYQCAPSMKSNFDGFDLFLRALIKKSFVNGDVLNAYIKLYEVPLHGTSVCVCDVARRSNLTFLQKDGIRKLYIRRGTSTSEIGFEQIENYYSLKRLF